MSKFTSEIAVSICEFLTSHSVVLDACRAHGVSNSSFLVWIARSRKEPPDKMFTFTWLEMEAPFWQHVQNAKRIYANSLLDTVTERARHGSERAVIYQGRLCYAMRDDIPPDMNDPDILEMLYDQRDRYLRVDGRLVTLTEHGDSPVALQLAVLASQFEAFQPHSSQSIEVTQRGESGVKIVGDPAKPEPIQIEHTPVKAELSNEVPATPTPEEAIQPTSEASMVEDFSTGAETAVDPASDRVSSSTFFKPAPPGSSKTPTGTVPVFHSESLPDDPVEIVRQALRVKN